MSRKFTLLVALASLAMAGCSGDPEETPQPYTPSESGGPQKFESGESAVPQGGPSTPNTEFK
jgi:hypothetical protein